MKYRIPALLSTLILVALGLSACGGGSTPDIEADIKFHDFGDVPQFEVVSVDIPLRNTGTGTLLIEEVSTSCGCTSASVDRNEVGPGDEVTLTVRYDSGLHPDNGSIYRKIFVQTNDPDQPELEIEVVANVVVGEG